MNLADLAQPHVRQLPIYQPGKPIELVAREYGLPLDSICKLASNENPLGPSPHAIADAREALEEVNFYPDGSCHDLRAALTEVFSLKPDQFMFGNGSNDLIELLAHVFINDGVEAVMGAYAFPVYRIVTELMGGKAVPVPMPDMRHDLDAMLRAITERTRVVFLPSTDNPTGTSNTPEEISAFMQRLPEHVVLLFDEAYAEFKIQGMDMRPYIEQGRHVFCTRTFSKLFGLAGLRIGYGYGSSQMIELLNHARQPFSVNRVAQAAAIAALSDVKFIKRTRAVNAMGLLQLYKGFEALGLSYTPSDGNFVLVAVPGAIEAFAFLQARGVIVRPMPPIGDYMRVSVGLEHQNRALLQGLEAWQKQLNESET